MKLYYRYYGNTNMINHIVFTTWYKLFRLCYLLNKLLNEFVIKYDITTFDFNVNLSIKISSINQLYELTNIYLVDSGVGEIPSEIEVLSNLEGLTIIENRTGTKDTISFVPPSIGKLHKLNHIHLRGNIITIPGTIGNLTDLYELDLSHNKIITIPETIGNLTNLHISDLSHNKIIAIPETIGNLINLSKLDLSYNKIIAIPETIGNLINLEEFYISNNPITDFPITLVKIKKLRRLSIRDTNIREFPENITELKKLCYLDYMDVGEYINMEYLGHSKKLKKWFLQKLEEPDYCPF
jgi:Leucine-rich repeat (LRR) protein